MKYQVKSSKLQDVQAKTVHLTAPAEDLGSVASNALTIPLSDLMEISDQEDFYWPKARSSLPNGD